MFSAEEREAIQQKTRQLRKVREGTWTKEELARRITERRMRWMEERKEEMLEKYKHLSPEEQAHRIVLLEHMGINPAHLVVSRVSENKIRIDSHNFCPYLEACAELGLDTRQVCKEIGEPSIQKMMQDIHPKLRFSRNYRNIRPSNGRYCEEYIELVQ
jgi:hypothetical protein